MPIHHANGPKTDAVTKKVAEQQLRSHPQFPKQAELEVWEQDGHWLAAWHQAEFPPSKDDGGEEEEAGPPKEEKAPEGPDEGGAPDEGGEGPPKEHGEEKGKGGEAHELTQLLHLVTQMAAALGIEPGGGAGMGPEGPMPPGPEGPPPGPPGPPHGHPGGPPGAGGPPGETIQHQRALKPGEAPPGTTPVGAPAFASTVPDSHPWKKHIGKSASFTISKEIPEDRDLASIDQELQHLAYNTRCPKLPGGFKVKQIGEDRNADGHRVAKALISAY